METYPTFLSIHGLSQQTRKRYTILFDTCTYRQNHVYPFHFVAVLHNKTTISASKKKDSVHKQLVKC